MRAQSCGGRDQGDLPQAVPSELRSLRREPLLPVGSRARPRPPGRDLGRSHDLRGHLAARGSGYRPRALRRPCRREHLCIAVSPGKGREREGMLASARATICAGSRSSTRSEVRTSSSSTVTRSCSTRTARSSPAERPSRRRSSWSRSIPLLPWGTACAMRGAVRSSGVVRSFRAPGSSRST